MGDENMDTRSLSEGELNKEEQKWVLELAENTVKAVVSRESVPEPVNVPEIAKKKRGAFVTLEKNEQLRGCIGYVLPIYPLYKTIIDVATSAALRDPRFPPVNENELKDITVEVSVLTVPKTITNPNQIEVGKHGIIIKRGYSQGLLLPQVATEYGWDRETFLEHTCLKAGLPTDSWKDKGTEIQIFSAQVFNRETLKSE
jgi:AmmeMemoRadiSam system protein A